MIQWGWCESVLDGMIDVSSSMNFLNLKPRQISIPLSFPDDDIDDNLAAVFISQGGQPRHRLEMIYNNHVLPYNITVYQAIRQFRYD